MNYCFNYYRKSRNMENEAIGEFNIKYDKQDNALITFLQTYPNKRVNLIIEDIEAFIANKEYAKLNAIKAALPDSNFAVCFGGLQTNTINLTRAMAATAHLENIPYYSGTIVTTWDAVHYLINHGVCDIYIGEQLGFELPTLSQKCKAANVKIRTFANVAQSSVTEIDPYLKFFIRPNDIELYAQYIDTIEFWGPEDRQDVLFEIYSKGRWLGDVNEIILGFKEPLDNKCIIPLFGQMRLNCGRKCLKGAHCRMCYTISNLATTMKDKNLIFKQ